MEGGWMTEIKVRDKVECEWCHKKFKKGWDTFTCGKSFYCSEECYDGLIDTYENDKKDFEKSKKVFK